MNNCVLCNKENPKLVCDECVKTTLKDKILCLEGRRINGEIEISGRYEIVDESDFLIGTPKGFCEELRSGTWSTIRYARKKGMEITIVYPDGSVKIENRKKS